MLPAQVRLCRLPNFGYVMVRQKSFHRTSLRFHIQAAHPPHDTREILNADINSGIMRNIPIAALGYIVGSIGSQLTVIADLEEKWQLLNCVIFAAVAVLFNESAKELQRKRNLANREIQISISSKTDGKCETDIYLTVNEIVAVCGNKVDKLLPNLSTYYDWNIQSIDARSLSWRKVDFLKQGKGRDVRAALRRVSKIIILVE